MTLTPIWLGTVEANPRPRIDLDRPQDYEAYLRTLDDQRVELIVRKWRSQRSLQQLRYIRWVGKFIALEYCGCDRHDYRTHARAAYEHLLGEFTGWVEALGGRVPKRRLSDLTTAEASEMVEWIPRYCAQEFGGLIVPLPNEADLSDLEEC